MVLSLPVSIAGRDQSVLEIDLPELLAGILSSDTLQDLCATWVLVYKCVHLVNIVVDDDVEALLDCVVLGDLLRCEGFGHCGGSIGGANGVDGDVRAGRKLFDRWHRDGLGMQDYF